MSAFWCLPLADANVLKGLRYLPVHKYEVNLFAPAQTSIAHIICVCACEHISRDLCTCTAPVRTVDVNCLCVSCL